ncbi:MAG: hypothetical protein V3V32_05330, partial [Dehalococcoidia bacterium]
MSRDRPAQTLQYPKNKNDSAGLLDFAENTRKNAWTYRNEIERNAMGNVLTYLGLHWIKYDTTSRIWRPMILRRKVPRPTTNKFAAIVTNTASRLTAVKPPLSINPLSPDMDDIGAAAVGDKVRQLIEREAKVRELKQHAAMWVLLTGNVFYISNYDLSSRSGIDTIPFDQCLECQ